MNPAVLIQDTIKALGARMSVGAAAIVQHGIVIWLMGSGTISLSDNAEVAAIVTSGVVGAVVGTTAVIGRTHTDRFGKMPGDFAIGVPPAMTHSET